VGQILVEKTGRHFPTFLQPELIPDLCG